MPADPLPGLPPTREQQLQAQRLDEAAAAASARVIGGIGTGTPADGDQAQGDGSKEGAAECERASAPSRLMDLLSENFM